MPVYGLRLRNVGPFQDIAFEFDERVNVLVGPNNVGKSCALLALANVAGYPTYFGSRFVRTGGSSFELLYGRDSSGAKWYMGELPIQGKQSGWAETDWMAYAGVLRDIGYAAFVPEMRLSSAFRSKGPAVAKDSPFDKWEEWRRSFLGHVSGRDRDVLYRVHFPTNLHADLEELPRRLSLPTPRGPVAEDADVIQTMVNFDYRSYREGSTVMRALIDKVATVASEITEGFPIRFAGVHEDEDGLCPRFSTPDGDLPLNFLSQGTQSIIQWLAYLLFAYGEYYRFPQDLEERPAILILDEIDAHLHPSWQRRIIPALTKHLPRLQLFASTHSPLMLAGLRTGQVQLLKRDESGKVTVSRNQTDIVGWSADEILRSFLDVAAPTDMKTADDVERLKELRAKERLSQEEEIELERLRRAVSQELLGGPIAGEVARLERMLHEERG